jgi:hypothetical protein
MRPRLPRFVLASFLAASVAACHTVAGDSMRPAVLSDASPKTMAAVTQVLAKVIGQGRVTLGPGDPTRDPTITVLPPAPGPYEGNSPSMPTYFEIVTDGKACFLREREKQTLHPLSGVSCRPK